MPNRKKKRSKNESVGLKQNEGGRCAGRDGSRVAVADQISKYGSKINDETSEVYFTQSEIQGMQTVFKVQDLTGIPVIIGAIVSNNLDLMDGLIKGGADVNETDQNNATAMIWAIKVKNMQCIEKLLLSGADVELPAPNGDHIVFIALDSKFWDEQSFMFLWNGINKVSAVNCSLLNKSGNSMLHMAVRREWLSFLNTLVARGVDVDIANSSGVTPLMLASYRHNLNVLDLFLSSGADFGRRDCHGFRALCYAFSSAISKNKRPPNPIVDRLIEEMLKAGFSFTTYVQECTTTFFSGTNLHHQHNGLTISTLLLHILIYIVRYVKEGLRVVLSLDVFEKLGKVGTLYTDHPDRLKVMLDLMYEILICVDDCPERKVLSGSFESSGCASLCLDVLQRYENNKNYPWMIAAAFRPIAQACSMQDGAEEWCRSNFCEVKRFYDQLCSANSKRDEKETLLPQEKMEMLDAFVKDCVSNIDRSISTCDNDEHETCSSQETRLNSKKTKRRTKALKAKIAKIKSADLAERLNLTGKKLLVWKSQQNKVPSSETTSGETESRTKVDEVSYDFQTHSEAIQAGIDDCNIVDSIKRNLCIGSEAESAESYHCEIERNAPVLPRAAWKQQILSLPFDSKFKKPNVFEDDFSFKPDEIRLLSGLAGMKLTEDNVEESLYPAIKYLKQLVTKIVRKYQKYWEIDEELEKEVKELTKDRITKQEDATIAGDQSSILEKLERQKIDLLNAEFDALVVHIKALAVKDLRLCRTLLKDVEMALLSHEIRGTTIIAEVCPVETIFVSVSAPPNMEIPNTNNSENVLTKYMEDVLNDRREPVEDIHITVTESARKPEEKIYMSDDVLYIEEMKALSIVKRPNARAVLEAQRRTLKSAYHVQPINVSEDAEENAGKSKDLDFGDYERMPKTMTFFNKNAYQNRSQVAFAETFVDPLRKPEADAETTRWCTLVRSLEMMENCQEFIGGSVRISCKAKRQSHVISTGGNFTPVELGLDACNRPLAVKRIPKGSCVCETIKTMLAELLDLHHKNLLHYFACDYDGNELIIATPLCEYNVGQYLMLMKQNQTNLTALEVVRQFLTGLLFLHGRLVPIVHGNLKPSNIFVDINGVVKVAEFGIHRALFKFKEAPNSSIIWFATETYRTFKQLSVMKCTVASDIQVAGMLVHFLMTAGKHPYGDDMRIILKNLDKAVPQLTANDLELEDLITWMLLYDPLERPSIQQVVTHVYFWSPERKWRFILTCAGLSPRTQAEAAPFKLEELHVCLEKVAFKDNIKGKWVQVVKQQFPKISFANNDDTPTGLLKFIRSCMDSKDPLCFHTDLNLSDYILTSFPAFALSLYRMLENSVWVKHPTFASFYSVDGIFT